MTASRITRHWSTIIPCRSCNNCVRFLAVEGAYITGHALNMNGGLYQG